MINLNFPSNSAMLPAFDIALHNSSIDVENLEQLVKVVLKEHPNIITFKSKRDDDDPNWITGKLWAYNFLDFDYPCVRYLQKFIYAKYLEYTIFCNIDSSKPVYIQCWVNIIYNNGRIITPHNHSDAHGNAPAEYCYISGNISLQTENTSTFFAHPILNKMSERVHREIPNINGELVLFPSFMTHWTSPNLSVNPRITIAFDIITEEVYNMIDNTNYRLLTKENI
jgi:hypothetical protein